MIKRILGLFRAEPEHTVTELRIPTCQETHDYCEQVWLALDVDLRFQIIAILVKMLNEDEQRNEWRKVIDADPLGWWTAYHFWQGMAIRNHLRDNGITDDLVGCNLDDIWVPAFEAAVNFLREK